MANEGCNGVKVFASDVPNIGSITSCCCNKPTIRGETTTFGIIIGDKEFNHNVSRIGFPDYDNFSITQSKLGIVWGESNVGTIVYRKDLVTFGIPLLDFAMRYGNDIFRVYG